jgi:hypothetical protein
VIVTRAPATNPRATTSRDAAQKARAPAKRSAASSATSPATSGDCRNRPTRRQERIPPITFLT